MMKLLRCVCCIRNHRRDRFDTGSDRSEKDVVESPKIVAADSSDRVGSSIWGSTWGKVSSSVYRQTSRWSSYGNKRDMRDRDNATRSFDKYMCIDSTIDEFVQDDDVDDVDTRVPEEKLLEEIGDMI